MICTSVASIVSARWKRCRLSEEVHTYWTHTLDHLRWERLDSCIAVNECFWKAVVLQEEDKRKQQAKIKKLRERGEKKKTNKKKWPEKKKKKRGRTQKEWATPQPAEEWSRQNFNGCEQNRFIYMCCSTWFCWLIHIALLCVCVYLFLLQRASCLLLCQHHLSFSSDLNALPQSLLQLLDALRLLTQGVLHDSTNFCQARFTQLQVEQMQLRYFTEN